MKLSTTILLFAFVVGSRAAGELCRYPQIDSGGVAGQIVEGAECQPNCRTPSLDDVDCDPGEICCLLGIDLKTPWGAVDGVAEYKPCRFHGRDLENARCMEKCNLLRLPYMECPANTVCCANWPPNTKEHHAMNKAELAQADKKSGGKV